MRVFLLSVLFLFAINAFAQSEAFRNYSNANGLPCNTVYAVQQDSKGFIWLATERGVSRFDGVYFQNFSTDDGLADNEIFRIYEDRLNRIWLIGYNGKLSFFYNGHIFNERKIPPLQNVKPQGMGLEISEDRDGNLWYVSSTAIYKYSTSGKLDSITFMESDNKRFLSKIRNDSEILFFSGAGIFKWNENKFYQEESITGLKLVPNTKVAETDDYIYFSAYENLLRRSKDLSESRTDTVYSFEGTIQALQIYNDALWVSTSNGAHRMDLNSCEKKLSILDGESVSWILIDHENILWASTLGSGVFFSANPQIKKYDRSNGLSQDAVFRLALLPGGELMAGHENFMISVIDQNSVSPFVSNRKDYRRGRIYSILVENEKSVWLVSEKIIHLSFNKGKINSEYINYSSKDMVRGIRPGEYYIAGSKGLTIFNSKEYRELSPTQWTGIRRFDESIRLSSLCFNWTRDKLFLGGNSGLLSFDPVGEKIERVNFSGEVFKNPVTKIIAYDEDFMALSTTMDGVFLFNEDSVIHINKKTGLSSDICNSLHKDSVGNIWVATAKGINKIVFSGKEIKILTFTKDQGLVSSEFYDVITKGENIYAASLDGVCVFRESQVRLTTNPPLLNLDEFIVSGTRLDPRKRNTLRSDQNHIRLSFTSLSFRSNKGISYRYKLEGLDNGWKKTSLSEIEYAYLPPGNYKFFLTATNGNNVYAKPVIVEFEIRKSFYSTGRFYGIITGIILLFFTLFIYSWFRRLNEKHKVKQITLQVERDHAEAEKKLIELEHMALRLHMNPHFVFNAINTIQGFYAANDILKAKSYISKFSRLIRSIMDTSREQRVPLSDEIDLLRNYLELCALRMEYPFSYEITWQEGMNPAECEISPMLVQPFVENAILHGITPLKGGGHIIISFSKKDNYLECVVEDNGIGRARAARLNVGKLHKSSGIRVTQERISLINKGAFVDSDIEILDLLDEKNLPAGTRIRFRTPYMED